MDVVLGKPLPVRCSVSIQQYCGPTREPKVQNTARTTIDHTRKICLDVVGVLPRWDATHRSPPRRTPPPIPLLYQPLRLLHLRERPTHHALGAASPCEIQLQDRLRVVQEWRAPLL